MLQNNQAASQYLSHAVIFKMNYVLQIQTVTMIQFLIVVWAHSPADFDYKYRGWGCPSFSTIPTFLQDNR